MARMRSHVGRLVAEPRDPRILHAVTPEEILRLDRETLEVLDRTPALSAHLAFSEDALGRLLGVEGGDRGPRSRAAP